jgi:hypothetical protein
MEEHFVEMGDCQCKVSVDRQAKVTKIIVNFEDTLDGNTFQFIAANPADHRASFSGSALPFPSPDFALEGTPNRGEMTLSNGTATLLLVLPNSYYAALGTVLIPPTVYITYSIRGLSKTVAIKVDDPIPFRTLTYNAGRTDASFYQQHLPVRSQEAIIRDSAYPEKTPSDFWGKKPAM